MWHQIGEVLVARSATAAAAQFAFILTTTLLTMYGIIRMRRDTVVVLSHGKLIVSTMLSSLVCVGFYQLLLWLAPADRWSKGWVIAVLMVALMIARMVTMALVSASDGGKSIRDTTADTGRLFNCNWPLISRCANQGFMYLLFVYLVMKDVWTQK